MLIRFVRGRLIADIVAELFNKSVITGNVPQDWDFGSRQMLQLYFKKAKTQSTRLQSD